MRSIIEPLLDDYSRQPEGKWLTEFDWRKVSFGKLPFVIDGLFVALYLAPLDTVLLEDPGRTKETFDVWASDVVHEMYHAYQRHTQGFLRYMLRKVFNRSELEEEAVNASLKWLELCGPKTRKA